MRYESYFRFRFFDEAGNRKTLKTRMAKKLIFASKGRFPDRRLMPLPAHSTSADHPVVPCNAPFRSSRWPLDSARGTAAGSACPGDCAPRGNGPRIAAGLGAAASPQTRSASTGIPVSPISPSVPHRRSNSDSWLVGAWFSPFQPRSVDGTRPCDANSLHTISRDSIACRREQYFCSVVGGQDPNRSIFPKRLGFKNPPVGQPENRFQGYGIGFAWIPGESHPTNRTRLSKVD